MLALCVYIYICIFICACTRADNGVSRHFSFYLDLFSSIRGPLLLAALRPSRVSREAQKETIFLQFLILLRFGTVSEGV